MQKDAKLSLKSGEESPSLSTLSNITIHSYIVAIATCIHIDIKIKLYNN